MTLRYGASALQVPPCWPTGGRRGPANPAGSDKANIVAHALSEGRPARGGRLPFARFARGRFDEDRRSLRRFCPKTAALNCPE